MLGKLDRAALEVTGSLVIALLSLGEDVFLHSLAVPDPNVI